MSNTIGHLKNANNQISNLFSSKTKINISNLLSINTKINKFLAFL